MASSVLLRLEAPLQAWGTQGRFGIRDTDSEPSKSGVIGLVGAALGMPRTDHGRLDQLTRLEMVVRVDREGALVRDYHTAGGGRFRGQPHGIWKPLDRDPTLGELGETALTERFYLADASFLVALGGDGQLISEIATALQAPAWPLFLGRKSCAPSRPIFAGTREEPPSTALEQAAFPARLARGRDGSVPDRLRMVVEAIDGQPRQDVPISFERHARRHARRFVESRWIPTPAVEEDAR